MKIEGKQKNKKQSMKKLVSLNCRNKQCRQKLKMQDIMLQ